MAMEAPLSPGAGAAVRDSNFRNMANNAKFFNPMAGGGEMEQLSPRSDGTGGMSHCICGMPMGPL